MYKSRFNNLVTGAILGSVLPLITLLLIYLIRFNGKEIRELFDFFIKGGILTQLLSLCAVPNLLAFFLFIWTNRLLSARGVLLATFIVAAIILIMKFVV